ncbi:MAG: hypothetical protein ABI651_18200 [Verrucomicrobiota bacterium]
MSLLIVVSAAALNAKSSAQVYPSGSTVPENLLRIELRFSIPIEPPLRVENLELIDANGAEIKEPFLDLLLSSPDDKRVTILFHPGRVKTAVGPNLALGRALHAGETVTLVIDHTALTKPVRKTWQVTAFDAQSPQPALWTFEPPQLGSRSPLVLHLDKPISSSAEDLIAIRGLDRQRLAGDAHLENGETIWRFVPAQPWVAGNYAVVTHPDLEDAAGNRPYAPFEVSDTSRVSSEVGTVQPFQLSNKQNASR